MLFEDRVYCKNKFNCSQVHTNADGVGECDDKEPVKKDTEPNAKMFYIVNSCEHLHTIEMYKKEMSEKNKLKKIIESKVKDFDETLILYSRDITDCKSRSYLMETEIEGDFEKAEAIDEEHSIKKQKYNYQLCLKDR